MVILKPQEMRVFADVRELVSYGQPATAGPERASLTPTRLHRGNRVFLVGEPSWRNVPTETSCNAARIRKTEFAFSRERCRPLYGVAWTDLARNLLGQWRWPGKRVEFLTRRGWPVSTIYVRS
jgi:hypothetical protein